MKTRLILTGVLGAWAIAGGRAVGQTPVDFHVFIFLDGVVCDARARQGSCWCLDGVLVSVGYENLTFRMPVDYTNWEGKFFIRDEMPFGYTLDASGEVMEGTTEVRPFASFTKPGFKELQVDLSPILGGAVVASATPLVVTLQPAGSVNEGTAGFSPSDFLPILRERGRRPELPHSATGTGEE